jgi:hypothetical protein
MVFNKPRASVVWGDKRWGILCRRWNLYLVSSGSGTKVKNIRALWERYVNTLMKFKKFMGKPHPIDRKKYTVKKVKTIDKKRVAD